MDTLKQIRNKFRLQEPAYAQELIDESDAEGDNYLKNASSNRTYTDLPFLVVHGTLLLVLVFFLGYCVINGDVDRLAKGYDDCGNVCGKKNSFDIKYQQTCQAQDMSNKPFLNINGDHRECIAVCETGAGTFGHFCISRNGEVEDLLRNGHELESFVTGFLKTLNACSNDIIYVSLISLGFTFIILLVLRYFAGVFIWSMLVGSLLASAAGAAYFGVLAQNTNSDGVLRATIFFSCFTVVMLIIILVVIKRIPLLIQLFKEAGKSVVAIPLLLFQPTMTFVALIILWSAWFYFTFWIGTAGTPTELLGKVTFEPTGVTEFTFWYNLFMMLWMIQFIYGCQNMIIAGAVSTWYFARDKSQLGRPIYNSAYNMIKYHLGTISCASLIVTIIQFVRILVGLLRRPLQYAVCIRVCLDYVEKWMKYFTRNACIITSIHGHNFRKAGSRAFELIVKNILQVIAINSLGNFVLVLAKILISLAIMAIGHFMIKDKLIFPDYEWFILMVMAFVAYMIAHSFFGVYEMAIDTIFICFCEDSEMNDGVMRPYFMSTDLMEFIENSKIVLKIKAVQKDSARPVVAV